MLDERFTRHVEKATFSDSPSTQQKGWYCAVLLKGPYESFGIKLPEAVAATWLTTCSLMRISYRVLRNPFLLEYGLY